MSMKSVMKMSTSAAVAGAAPEAKNLLARNSAFMQMKQQKPKPHSAKPEVQPKVEEVKKVEKPGSVTTRVQPKTKKEAKIHTISYSKHFATKTYNSVIIAKSLPENEQNVLQGLSKKWYHYYSMFLKAKVDITKILKAFSIIRILVDEKCITEERVDQELKKGGTKFIEFATTKLEALRKQLVQDFKDLNGNGNVFLMKTIFNIRSKAIFQTEIDEFVRVLEDVPFNLKQLPSHIETRDRYHADVAKQILSKARTVFSDPGLFGDDVNVHTVNIKDLKPLLAGYKQKLETLRNKVMEDFEFFHAMTDKARVKENIKARIELLTQLKIEEIGGWAEKMTKLYLEVDAHKQLRTGFTRVYKCQKSDIETVKNLIKQGACTLEQIKESLKKTINLSNTIDELNKDKKF